MECVLQGPEKVGGGERMNEPIYCPVCREKIDGPIANGFGFIRARCGRCGIVFKIFTVREEALI